MYLNIYQGYMSLKKKNSGKKGYLRTVKALHRRESGWETQFLKWRSNGPVSHSEWNSNLPMILIFFIALETEEDVARNEENIRISKKFYSKTLKMGTV